MVPEISSPVALAKLKLEVFKFVIESFLGCPCVYSRKRPRRSGDVTLKKKTRLPLCVVGLAGQDKHKDDARSDNALLPLSVWLQRIVAQDAVKLGVKSTMLTFVLSRFAHNRTTQQRMCEQEKGPYS